MNKKYKIKFLNKDKIGNSKNLIAMLLPSMLSIFLCAICLLGSTWGWFTTSQSMPTQEIKAAKYEIEATVNNGEVKAQDGRYKLTANTDYSIELKAKGSAATGYCILRFGNGESYVDAYTHQIPLNGKITIPIRTEKSVDLQIIARWGSLTTSEQRLPYDDNKIFVLQ